MTNLVLIQLSLQIQFEIHELCGTQCDDYLPLVRRCCHDRFGCWSPPFVYSAIGKDMANAVRVDLQECIGPNLLDRQRRGRREETRVLNFLYCFTNGEDQSTVDEGEDDVRVVNVCSGSVRLLQCKQGKGGGKESSVEEPLST